MWVKSVVLSLCQPLPVYPHQRTSSDRCGWSGWRKKKDRENRKCNIAKRQSTFPASQTTTENCPAGKSPKTCPAPLTKIFRLTRRANHLYKFAPSRMRGGSRIVTNARVGCDGRDSVGRAGGRRAGLPVSDRTARGRTTLPTVFARTRRVHEARQDLWRGRARTAKSCGPGAPMLASSLAEMHLAQPGSGCIVNPKGDGGKQAGHRGEREVSRKPFAQGKPAYSG